jgi:hypothetical protein
MDGFRFDELIGRITTRRAFRRLFIKGLLGAGVPGVAALRSGLDGLEVSAERSRRRIRCHGDWCDGTGGKRCGKTDRCQCYRAAEGGHVCASSLQSSCDRSCRKDRDCRRGDVCVEGGPACCGSGQRFCKRACRR